MGLDDIVMVIIVERLDKHGGVTQHTRGGAGLQTAGGVVPVVNIFLTIPGHCLIAQRVAGIGKITNKIVIVVIIGR